MSEDRYEGENTGKFSIKTKPAIEKTNKDNISSVSESEFSRTQCPQTYISDVDIAARENERRDQDKRDGVQAN